MAKVNINPKKLGQEISQLRETKQIPLDKIAESSGLSVAYLEQLEAGEVDKVRKKELKRLGKALEMPTPCVHILGVQPEEIPDKLMGQLAESVQGVIRAIVKAQMEHGGGSNGTADKKPKPKPKKKNRKKK